MSYTLEKILAFSNDSNHENVKTGPSDCEGISQIVNYCQAYYDTDPKWRWSILVLQTCLILLLISLLSSTTESYFVPPIKYISERLRIPDHIAGITLLAAGNGAPDVFSAVSGIDSQSDFGVTVGLLLGASIFTTTVILASVLIVAKPKARAVPSAFVRDVCAYIVTTLSILIICSDGKIWLYEALTVLCCYATYLAIVVCSHYLNAPSTAAANHDCESLLTASNVEKWEDNEMASIIMESDMKQESFSGVSSTPETDSSQEKEQCFHGLEIFSVYPNHHKTHLLWRRLLIYLQSGLELPFTILRILSIPAPGALWGPIRRITTALSPFSLILLAYFRINHVQNWELCSGSFLSSSIPLWLAMEICAIPAVVFLFLYTRPCTRPCGFAVILFAGLSACIVWLDLFADELVGLVEAIGVETSVKTANLGLTLLAIGNSIGDFVADTAFAKAGNPQTGFSSCFGSPMLNDILDTILLAIVDSGPNSVYADRLIVAHMRKGLGIALAVSCVKEYGKPLSVHVTRELYISWGFLLVSLASSLVVFTVSGFQPPRAHAYFLCGLYALFFTFVVATQVGFSL